MTATVKKVYLWRNLCFVLLQVPVSWPPLLGPYWRLCTESSTPLPSWLLAFTHQWRPAPASGFRYIWRMQRVLENLNRNKNLEKLLLQPCQAKWPGVFFSSRKLVAPQVNRNLKNEYCFIKIQGVYLNWHILKFSKQQKKIIIWHLEKLQSSWHRIQYLEN